MTVSTTTFTTHTAGLRGGVFYVTSLAALTLSGVTTTGISAPSGGRFIYFTNSQAFSLTINSASSFTCSST